MSNCIHVILATLSMLIGFVLLVASALAIDKYKNGIKQCYDKEDVNWVLRPDSFRTNACTPFFIIAAVAGLGLVASAFQIIFNLCALVRRSYGGKLWAGIHALIFVLCLIAFGLGLHFLADNKDPLNIFFNLHRDKDINRYLIAINCIDFIFSFGALIVSACLPTVVTTEHRYSQPAFPKPR